MESRADARTQTGDAFADECLRSELRRFPVQCLRIRLHVGECIRELARDLAEQLARGRDLGAAVVRGRPTEPNLEDAVTNLREVRFETPPLLVEDLPVFDQPVERGDFTRQDVSAPQGGRPSGRLLAELLEAMHKGSAAYAREKLVDFRNRSPYPDHRSGKISYRLSQRSFGRDADEGMHSPTHQADAVKEAVSPQVQREKHAVDEECCYRDPPRLEGEGEPDDHAHRQQLDASSRRSPPGLDDEPQKLPRADSQPREALVPPLRDPLAPGRQSRLRGTGKLILLSGERRRFEGLGLVRLGRAKVDQQHVDEELIDPFSPFDVLEPVVAEVAKGDP